MSASSAGGRGFGAAKSSHSKDMKNCTSKPFYPPLEIGKAVLASSVGMKSEKLLIN